ncbi:MAG: hypothetical protein EHM50_06560 [Lysobacterales bacterium]|nr:MAG: hypothetical protein EHM50_06560 [Xanthomonadales bacterium]
MTMRRTAEDATLLDVLVDGFEKNEVLDGFHWRQLPLPDERAAARKFSSLTEEARRWKGPPARIDEQPGRRLSAWPDLEIRLAGRGLLLRARASQFNDWWHDERTWQGDPMAPAFDWIAEK